MQIETLNDKYYKFYTNYFNQKNNKYSLIIDSLLYNYSYSYCEDIKKTNFILKDTLHEHISSSFSYNSYIIQKFYKSNDSKLLISNISSILYSIGKQYNVDGFLLNAPYTDTDTIKKETKYKNTLQNVFSSHISTIYKNELAKLINDNSAVQQKQYDKISISCGFKGNLSYTASYRMLLELPYILGSLGVAFKTIAKGGDLLLFWTVINVHVPSVRKLLALLVYAFENVQVVDNDINQNFFQGITEYYIKCSGFKDNIPGELVNQLLEEAIKAVDYTYDICDVINYYKEYASTHPRQTLFYKMDPSKKSDASSKSSRSSRKRRSSIGMQLFTNNSTRRKSKHTSKTIKYIADIDLPILNGIAESPEIQYELLRLTSRLDNIFIACFEKINNMISNSLYTDKSGQLAVKPEAVQLRKYNDMRNFVAMLEYNKISYNKHILTIMREEEDKLIEKFYGLTNTLTSTLVKYTDDPTRRILDAKFQHFKLLPHFQNDEMNKQYDRVEMAYQIGRAHV